jgi:hypothetical protein
MSRITFVQGSRVVAVVGAVLVVAVAVGLVAARGSRADAATEAAVPTATVTSRVMAVTSEVDGTVRRAARYEVAFGATQVALASDAAAGGSAGGSTGASAAWSDAGATTVAFVMEVGADPIAEPTVEPTVDPTVDPTPDPTPDPTVEPTVDPTVDPTPDPTPDPNVDLTPTATPRTAPSDGVAPAPSAAPDASRTGGGAIAAPESVGSTAAAAVTLTSIAALGTVVETGTVLYSAAGEPVVAVRADPGSGAVLWRDLTIGVDDGADVRTLEEALALLGYGDGLTVDETFTSVTAAAVERWERDLGRLDPDGVVELGDLVVVLDEAEVDARLVELGATLRTGTTVLTLASASQVVTARVDAARLPEWPVGGPVTLEWSDGATTAAHVVATGRDVVDATVEIVVGIDAEVPGRATGTPVTVVRATDRRDGALTVPIAAIVQGREGRSNVVVLDGDARRQVPVTVGVVSGGWVEVSGLLTAGELVVMPG